MALEIITAAMRLAKRRKVNIAIFGESGIGKTTLCRALDPSETMFIDLEAGTLAIEGWEGGHIDVRKESIKIGAHPWEVARGLAVYFGGPDPSDTEGPYGLKALAIYTEMFGSADVYAGVKTLFIDSITVASRMCFDWCKKQPTSFNEKGKPDNRSAYGLLGQEMVRWLTHIQHSPRSTIVVGILDKETDDLKRVTYKPQVEGGKTGRELPGIFDEVITMADIAGPNNTSFRALVCHQNNPWGFPAKDRSGCLEQLEPPDLAALLRKIHAGKRLDAKLVLTLPAAPPPATPETAVAA